MRICQQFVPFWLWIVKYFNQAKIKYDCLDKRRVDAWVLAKMLVDVVRVVCIGAETRIREVKRKIPKTEETFELLQRKMYEWLSKACSSRIRRNRTYITSVKN